MSDTDTYGQKRSKERKEQLVERKREVLNKRFDRAYMSFTDGNYAEAAKQALYIYFALDQRGELSGGYHEPSFIRGVVDEVDEIDKYDMQDREPAGNCSYALRGSYLGALIREFEDLAEDTGFQMDMGKVADPSAVLRWFRDRDCDVGVSLWNRLCDRPPIAFRQSSADIVLSSLNLLEAAATERGILEDDEKPTYRLENDESDESWLFGEYADRVSNGQDLVTVVSAKGERGVGKTVLALKLAQRFDRTDSGVTRENVTVHPEELRDMYVDLPKGSALILDEAEAGLSNRKAMTNSNQAIRDLMNMGRVEEKYLFVIAPAADHLDKSVEQLSAAWILCDDLGEAWVHEYDYNPYQGEVRTPKRERLKWWDLQDPDLEAGHDAITEMKRAKLRGEDDSPDRIDSAQLEARVKEARQTAEQDTRNDLLRELYESTSLSQQQLANAVDLSRSRVADIVSE